MPTYRTNGAWGSGIGVNLTPAQVDDNFYELRTALDDVIANPPPANSIANITENGFAWTVTLTEGDVLGPFPIPVVLERWRGEWAPSQLYEVLDKFVRTGQGEFTVLYPHTSAATFDPAATGADVTAGSFIVGANYTIVSIGTTDFTAIGASSNTVGLLFNATGVGTGTGTASPGALYLQTSGEPVGHTVTGIVAATYTPVLTDADTYLQLVDAAGVAVTIPAEADVDFPIGCAIAFEQAGSGALTIAGDTGVTVNCNAALTPVTNGQFAVAQIKKTAADTWTIFGYLVPA